MNTEILSLETGSNENRKDAFKASFFALSECWKQIG